MKVIVDTVIWSLLLRRKNIKPSEVAELSRLILADRAGLLGLVRQEILSGLNQKEQFERVRRFLEPYRDIPVESAHYVMAAEFSNTCRRAGVQGSNVDFLICAVAVATGFSIYTNDNDFQHYARHLPIKLHSAGM